MLPARSRHCDGWKRTTETSPRVPDAAILMNGGFGSFTLEIESMTSDHPTHLEFRNGHGSTAFVWPTIIFVTLFD